MTHHPINATRVFIWLFVFTAAEVLLCFAVQRWGLSMPRWAYWGGLLAFAFLKGLLIAKEFMHLKFEGWVVKGLIAPTPFLMLVIYFVLTGDVNHDLYEEGKLNYPIGSMVNEETGEVVTEFPTSHAKFEKHSASGAEAGAEH